MIKIFLFFCFFNLNSLLFDDNGNFVYRALDFQPKKEEKFIKPYLNLVLSVSLGLSVLSNFLFFNAINNKYVEKELKKKNPKVNLSEIKSGVMTCFVLSLFITSILIYVYYVYNI